MMDRKSVGRGHSGRQLSLLMRVPGLINTSTNHLFIARFSAVFYCRAFVHANSFSRIIMLLFSFPAVHASAWQMSAADNYVKCHQRLSELNSVRFYRSPFTAWTKHVTVTLVPRSSEPPKHLAFRRCPPAYHPSRRRTRTHIRSIFSVESRPISAY